MNLPAVAQTLQLITWFLALAEFIVALYVLLLNAWHTSNRHVSLLLLTFAINNFAIGLMIGVVDVTQAALPTYLLAVTSPAIQPGLLLVAVVLLKPRWLQGPEPFGLSLRAKPVEGRGRWRWGWWLVYGLTFLPVLLTLVDTGLGTRLWYTGLDAATYAGGYVPLFEYTAGSLSLLVKVLNFYGVSALAVIPLLYVALRDKEATPLTRRLAWLLLGAQIAGMIIQMGLRSLLGPVARVFITGIVFVLAYAYAGFRQMISERRLQRGRLRTRLTALILVITVPILVAVVAFVRTRAGALIEQVAIQQQEAELLSALRQFQWVAWAVLAVGVGMLLVLVWLTIRQAFRPIGTLTDTVAAIADGDLTRVAPVESDDEVGVLARAFNQMTEQLRDLISGLEQRVAERTRDLSVSEKRFRDVAESTADWIWEVDATGRYTYCSESVVNVLGYTPEEILGKMPFEFMPPDEAARVGEVFAEVVANKQPIVDLENRNLAQDGREVVVLTNGVPILDDEGNLLGYRGVDKDVTERVQAESRVQERRMYLEAVLRAAPDAIVTLDANYRIVEWNPGAESLFGYSRQEVIGQNIDHLITNPDTFEEAVGLSQVITDG
ncbi:MAG: PAS domain S-box protein, partial [Chloroflexi bacterium]|nr:PAS domain S-box protein [Chloroflexota bacterium]